MLETTVSNSAEYLRLQEEIPENKIVLLNTIGKNNEDIKKKISDENPIRVINFKSP